MHFASMLLHFALVLHFAAILITFFVNITFCGVTPGAYIFQRPFLRGLSTEGNLDFKTDWASLIVRSKFTVFALFYFVFDGNFSTTSPRGAYIWRDNLTEGILRYRFGGGGGGGLYLEGLIHGRAYFRYFTVFHNIQAMGKTLVPKNIFCSFISFPPF